MRHPENAVVVDLEDEHFGKLVVEVEDPAATVSLLKGGLAQWRAGRGR